MKRPALHVSLSLAIAGTTCVIQRSNAFTSTSAPPHHYSRKHQRQHHQLKACGSEDDFDSVHENRREFLSEAYGSEDDFDSIHENRREFLSDAAKASIFSIIAASSSTSPAYANDDIMKDDGKVALRTSTDNIPQRYVGTSAQPVAADDDFTTGAGSPDSPAAAVCGPDPDERRIAVFERVAPSVVYIDTFVEARDAFSPNVMEVPLGAGSGFVWDDKGHIVTNYHVVNKMQQAQVAILTKVMPDAPTTTAAKPASPSVANRNQQKQESGQFRTSMRPTSLGSDMVDYTRKIYKAKVIGVDPGKDIAVLKVDAPVFDLYPISLGTSSGLRVGQACLAIGNVSVQDIENGLASVS